MVLHDKEKQVIVTLALKGEMNINKLASATTLNLTTTRRVLKRLKDLDLVWISNKRTKPREEIVHSLTPEGIVLAFNNMGYDKIPYLIANYESYTPAYIKYYRQFEKRGLLEEARKLFTENDLIYPSTDEPATKEDNLYLRFPNLLIIKKNVINMNFISKVLENKVYNKKYKLILIELIKKDDDFKEVWIRWITIQTMILDDIKEISEKANIS